MDNRIQHTISRDADSLLASRSWHQQPAGEEFPDLAPGLVMSTFRARQVWSGMAWRRAFPGRGDQSALARRMVGQLLADTERVEDARWVTAELVSNALRYSRSGQARGFFVVEVLLGSEMVRIVVYDLGGGAVPDFSRTPSSVPETAEHGRGLLGVAELAVRVGVAGDAGSGHAVWADLALTVDAGGAWAKSEETCPGTASAGAAGMREVDLAAVGSVAEGALACDEGALVGGEGKADRVSAFGQELRAQQALAELRRDWPDWAFLVVHCRWLAMRGKEVVVSAAGPQELRHALPSIPGQANLAEPDPAPGAAAFGSTEFGVSAAVVLPTLAGLLHRELGVSWTGASSPPSVSASRRGAGGVPDDGGSGAGVSGPLPSAVPSGVMAAERSVTGTWAVVGGDEARAGWLPSGWLRRRRSRPGSRTRQGAGSAGTTGRADEDGARHRRGRSRLSAQAAAVAA